MKPENKQEVHIRKIKLCRGKPSSLVRVRVVVKSLVCYVIVLYIGMELITKQNVLMHKPRITVFGNQRHRGLELF